MSSAHAGGGRVAYGVAKAPDFQPHEIVIAVLIAVAVQIGAGVALKMAALDKMGDAAEIEKGPEQPVRVIPVLDMDSPLLKLGGKKAKMPEAWKVKPPPVPRAEERAFVSTKAGKTEQDIPDKEIQMADGGPPPPPDADVTKVAEDAPEADAGGPGAKEEGFSDGVKGGTETDPLKRRAIDVYRGRLMSWFQRGFHVTGTGLPPEELKKLRVVATVQMSGLTVSGYSITPSGNAAIDAAARARLDSVKGSDVPHPPDNFPDLTVPNPLTVVFACGSDCN
jgi:hypothetical protein